MARKLRARRSAGPEWVPWWSRTILGVETVGAERKSYDVRRENVGWGRGASANQWASIWEADSVTYKAYDRTPGAIWRVSEGQERILQASVEPELYRQRLSELAAGEDAWRIRGGWSAFLIKQGFRPPWQVVERAIEESR